MTRIFGGIALESSAKPARRSYPFMATDTNTRVSTTRIMEALVIAGITSATVYIFSVPKLEGRLDRIEEVQKVFNDQMNEQMRDTRTEIRQLRQDVYVPAVKSSLSNQADSLEPAHMTRIHYGPDVSANVTASRGP